MSWRGGRRPPRTVSGSRIGAIAVKAYACGACYDPIIDTANWAGCPKCGGNKTVTFHSTGERDRYMTLRLLQSAGKIKNLRRQHRFDLKVNTIKLGTWACDYDYIDCETGLWVVEDWKGARTALFNWKKKHVEAQYGIKIRITSDN